MRTCIAVCLLVAACSGDGSTGGTTTTDPLAAERAFLADWDLPAGPDFDGHPTKIDEEQRMLVMGDCDLAQRATGDGGPYGPSPRDPITQESEPGYAHICPSGGE